MKKDNTLISIVVPIYNMEKYLDKCINSIINQTYKNIEIILVDDGSTDKSSKIINKYKKLDKRIKAYYKKNGGLSDARNYGIDKATGEYIGFIDSDDYIEKNMYETLYNNIIKYNADISVVGFNVVYESTDIKNRVEYQEVTDKLEIYNRKEAFDLLFDANKFGNFAWNKLYKKELFKNIKYPLCKKMEDLGTTYKLVEISNKIVYEPLKLYNYFQRSGSIMNNKDLKFMKDIYLLSYERFIYYDNKYGFNIDNHNNMISTLLFIYSYVEDEDKLYKDILKRVHLLKIIKYLNNKEKIKIFILKLNHKLFKLLFTKKDII